MYGFSDRNVIAPEHVSAEARHQLGDIVGADLCV
jgi:hypothetical protein